MGLSEACDLGDREVALAPARGVDTDDDRAGAGAGLRPRQGPEHDIRAAEAHALAGESLVRREAGSAVALRARAAWPWKRGVDTSFLVADRRGDRATEVEGDPAAEKGYAGRGNGGPEDVREVAACKRSSLEG